MPHYIHLLLQFQGINPIIITFAESNKFSATVRRRSEPIAAQFGDILIPPEDTNLVGVFLLIRKVAFLMIMRQLLP